MPSIRDATEADAAAICDIYNHYITDSHISFEERPVTEAEMRQRMAALPTSFPWLVIEEGEKVQGYAYAKPWSDRSAYRHSAECAVYLDKDQTGQGLGKALYTALIDRLQDLSIHSVIGGVALPNPASVALHESMGFEKVAHFKEVGWKMNRWIDVAYWELMLT